MHFNIYVDDETGRQLNLLAEQQGATRNALIRQALREWLQKKTDAAGWPSIVQDFQGVTDAVPFESLRSELTAPASDPLA